MIQIFFVASLLFAHNGGHGPVIRGNGSHGGPLTAIIKAQDAEKGVNAEIQAVAEWKVETKTAATQETKITMWLLDKEQKKPVLTKKGTTIKWILMDQIGKPQVIHTDVEKPSPEISATLTSAQSKNLRMIEVIFTDLTAVGEKQVTALPLLNMKL